MHSRHFLFTLALAFLFSGCSHGPLTGDRETASSETSDQDPALGFLLTVDDPRAETKALVARLLKIRLRAQKWLMEFDQSLSSAQADADLFGNPIYRRLLVARSLIESTEHKIVDLYSETREITNRRSDNMAERNLEDKAFLVVAGVRDALLEVRKDLSHRVLLNDLVRSLKASFTGGLAGVDPLEGKELISAVRRAEPRIRKLVRELPASDEIVNEVEAGVAETDWAGSDEGREPQSAKIYPSTGAPGQINGREYPARTWSLTYDDGPSRRTTPEILANLKAQGFKATFFWLAQHTANMADIVRSAMGQGQEMANHSYTHAQLTKLGAAGLNKEISQSTQVHAGVFGFAPRLFRCPYGAKNNTVRAKIAENKMVHVLWNVDSLDWQDKNPSSIVARVKKQMAQQGKGIVLFHDIHTQSVAATLALMREWDGEIRSGQKRFLTVGEAIAEINR